MPVIKPMTRAQQKQKMEEQCKQVAYELEAKQCGMATPAPEKAPVFYVELTGDGIGLSSNAVQGYNIQDIVDTFTRCALETRCREFSITVSKEDTENNLA